jgi:DNA-binding transcriptional ArsR family regulator
MDRTTQRLYEGRVKVIKALAHPSRLYIVDKLAEREYPVNELTGLLGCDISTVSRHLSILKNAGIVKDDKRGASILNFFKCADAVLKAISAERADTT